MPEDEQEAEIWMDLLTEAHYQGCGHIKLMMENPDLYGYGRNDTAVNLLDVPKVRASCWCLFLYVGQGGRGARTAAVPPTLSLGVAHKINTVCTRNPLSKQLAVRPARVLLVLVR